jgi:hypothetical protein
LDRQLEPKSLDGVRADPSSFDPETVYESHTIDARRAAYAEYMAAMRRAIPGPAEDEERMSTESELRTVRPKSNS